MKWNVVVKNKLFGSEATPEEWQGEAPDLASAVNNALEDLSLDESGDGDYSIDVDCVEANDDE